MKYSVYILECSDTTLYVGCTNNLERRLKEHNESKRGAHYTKIRRPVKLVYTESFRTLRKARQREYEIKTWSREKKLALIKMFQAKELNFQYPEDKKFFIDLLANGDEGKFDKEFRDLFDFRDPEVKRKEFKSIRNSVFEKLISQYGKKCQLRIHPDCSNVDKFDIDHYIPLSSNELNKKLRNMKRTDIHKVPAQSFGSNDVRNLIIACSRCNAYKKHRIVKVNLRG